MVVTTEEEKDQSTKKDNVEQPKIEYTTKEQEEISRIDQIINNSFLGEILNGEDGLGITDIDYNGTTLWVQHNLTGRAVAPVQPTTEEVYRVIKQIANEQNKELTNIDPELNTELGYLRVNAMHAELSPDGMSFSIRVSRPRLAIRSIREMTSGNSKEVEGLLKVLMKSGSNLIISGMTGTGKTELQKLLVGYIDNRIVLIEDTRDSHIKTLYPEKDITSWVTKKSEDPTKEVTMQDLVRAMLRNNPDWGIIAEIRGKEAADALDAAKSGHSIITTLHAESATLIPSRFIPMVKQSDAYATISEDSIGKDIAQLLRFGLHLELEFIDGVAVRTIKEIVEYTGYKDNQIVGNYLYREVSTYNEKTKEYEKVGKFNSVSEKTKERLKDRRVFHELPKIFTLKKQQKMFEDDKGGT